MQSYALIARLPPNEEFTLRDEDTDVPTLLIGAQRFADAGYDVDLVPQPTPTPP